MDTTQAHRSLPEARQKHSVGQEPFARTRSWLVFSCALGLGVGFLLAVILSMTLALELPLGLWWVALLQTHGHIQLFGWAGLLVLGVALHFLPRLRGTPLVCRRAVSWLLPLLGGGLALRALSQPLLALAAPGALLWQILLAAAGLAEGVGASGIVSLFCLTLRRGPSLAHRPALQAFMPYARVGLFCCWLALALNAIEGIRLLLMGQVLLSGQMDLTITQLGLFGFLVPMALGMAARVLPLYLGLRPLSARMPWSVISSYVAGLALTLLALWMNGYAAQAGYLQGVGSLLMGGALLAFISSLLYLLVTISFRNCSPLFSSRRDTRLCQPTPANCGPTR